MKLIVGLGNPGKEYEKTRHNIGFMALDKIAIKNSVKFNKEKFGGLFTELNKKNEKIILLKPQNYINLSGEVINRYIKFYKISVEDVLIINDDLDLPVGKMKLKMKGGSGGHNGLKNIEFHLKTKEYKRLKIGISNNKSIDTKNYVLGKFSKEESEKLNRILNIVPDVFEDYLNLTFENLMNKYNK